MGDAMGSTGLSKARLEAMHDGWAGGLGTAWRVDPSEDLITILMTQKALTSPAPPNVFRDFWTAAYAAIDD